MKLEIETPPHAMSEEQLLAYLREQFGAQLKALDAFKDSVSEATKKSSSISAQLSSNVSVLMMGNSRVMILYQEALDALNTARHRLREAYIHVEAAGVAYDQFSKDATAVTMDYHHKAQQHLEQVRKDAPPESSKGKN